MARSWSSTSTDRPGSSPTVSRPSRRRGGPAAHGDQDLVGLDVAAVGEGRDHRTIGAIAPRGGQGDTGDDGDALGREGSRKLVTGEGLLPAQEPLAASTTVTSSQPAGANAWAISAPMAPPPSTSSRRVAPWPP